jgi:peptidoglycan-associated lipoprotein
LLLSLSTAGFLSEQPLNMKSIVLSSVVTALLIFSGCADKKPAVDEKANEVESNKVKPHKVLPVQTETISLDNSSISSENSEADSKTILEVEKELSSIYFDFDKFYIRSNMQSRLSNDATIAKNEASNFSVKLEGNCDEWGSDEYNFALGLKRAEAVKKAMIAEGVESNRITMVSYGESNPICTDKTQQCWSKNRRVDFKLLP